MQDIEGLAQPDSSRRKMLMTALAGAAIPLGACSTAKPTASAETAPVVWKGLTQAELDRAYDQSAYAPNSRQVLARYRARSDEAVGRIGAPTRIAYGASTMEALDLYRAPIRNAPTHVFVHGGAWRGTDARDYGFLAEMFVKAGINFVVLDFTPVQDLNGDLSAMATQVENGLLWVIKNQASFAGSNRNLTVSGHSSGAHLLAVALTRDWRATHGVAPRPFHSALLISGLYDLKPVRLSSRSNYVHLDDAAEAALSPGRHIDRLVCPVTIGYASLDTPEFQRQSRDLAFALNTAGRRTEVIEATYYNHFEELDTLGNPYGMFGLRALADVRRKT